MTASGSWNQYGANQECFYGRETEENDEEGDNFSPIRWT